MDTRIFTTGRIAAGVALVLGTLALHGEELDWDASWDTSGRAAEAMSCVTGTPVAVDAVAHSDIASGDNGLDAIFLDREESAEGALDRRPSGGLWILIN